LRVPIDTHTEEGGKLAVKVVAREGRDAAQFVERELEDAGHGFDFILNAMDAIVNHLDKIAEISHGEFTPTMILRIVVGNKDKPLFTGKTHTQDFSFGLKQFVKFPVIQLVQTAEIVTQYQSAYKFLDWHSTALVEYKDLM